MTNHVKTALALQGGGDLGEVMSRAAQLVFSSKLGLDKKLFSKFNNYIDLVAAIDQELPPDRHWRVRFY